LDNKKEHKELTLMKGKKIKEKKEKDEFLT
jgi:hypothetical protein